MLLKWRVVVPLLILVSLTVPLIISMTRPEAAYEHPARERRLLFDGSFEGVVRTTGRIGFLMPGQSGDRSGEITIYALPSKISCGTAPVHFVGNFTLDYEEDTRLVTLDRPRSALWDLNECSIRFRNLYPDL